MERFTLDTSKRSELIDITDEVSRLVAKSDVKDGTCLVFVPHATAAITVIENYDPDICTDFLEWLDNEIPQGKWRHDKVDGNGASHIKAALVGPSENLIIDDGKISLGTWQSLVLCEFDGPRKGRKVLVRIS